MAPIKKSYVGDVGVGFGVGLGVGSGLGDGPGFTGQAMQSWTGVVLKSPWNRLEVVVLVPLQQTSCLQLLLQLAEAELLALARLEATLAAEAWTAVAAVAEAWAEAWA